MNNSYVLEFASASFPIKKSKSSIPRFEAIFPERCEDFEGGEGPEVTVIYTNCLLGKAQKKYLSPGLLH